MEKMGGSGTPVQMDESFHRRQAKEHAPEPPSEDQIGRNGYAEKTAVFGMLETGTRQVRAQVVPNVKRATLQKAILDNVGFGSTIHTDRWPGYDGLNAKEFVHETVNHMNEYVSGRSPHSGNREFLVAVEARIERNLCRGRAMHMDRYLDEQMFRFNNRIGHNDGTRFVKALSQVVNRRLTYAELTGKEAGVISLSTALCGVIDESSMKRRLRCFGSLNCGAGGNRTSGNNL